MTSAVLAWLDRLLRRCLIAETARFIELNYLEVVCGYQDAYMATFGGLNYLDFRDEQFYRPLETELFGAAEALAAALPVTV